MLKTLFKKQLIQIFSSVNTKRRGRNALSQKPWGLAVLLLLSAVLVGAMIGTMAFNLARAWVGTDIEWLYFSIMSVITLAFGILFSAFSTYSTIYQAKDNEMLLAMPIPSWMIVLVRMLGVIVMSFLYSAIVWIPAVVVYGMAGGSFIGIFASILMLVLFTALITVLSCLLGWVVALIASKVKFKNLAITVVSIIGLLLYFFVISFMEDGIVLMIENGQNFGQNIKAWAYPLYVIGRACCGNALSFVLLTSIIGLLFALCYWGISKTFYKLLTIGKSAKKIVYKAKATKQNSIRISLIKKEFKRFFTSPVYLLNCGLGVVFMLLASVFVIITGAEIRDALGELFAQFPDLVVLIPIVITMSVCFFIASICISFPSISLEGPCLAILQSLPIRPQDIFFAKEGVHFICTAVPAVILTSCLAIAIRITWVTYLSILPFVLLFVWFTAQYGMMWGIKKVMVNWSTPTEPIKRNVWSLVVLLTGILLVLLFGAISLFLVGFMPFVAVIWIDSLLLAVLNGLLIKWKRTYGVKYFCAL